MTFAKEMFVNFPRLLIIIWNQLDFVESARVWPGRVGSPAPCMGRDVSPPPLLSLESQSLLCQWGQHRYTQHQQPVTQTAASQN